MFNKMLGLMKEGSMRKTAVILLIALFVVFCSVGAYAQQITKVDKEKFDKLTPEQKEKFKSDQEKARDTALEGVKAEKEVLEKAKDVAGTVARYTTAVTIGAIEGGPPKALRNAVASAVYEITKDNAKKEGEK